MLISTQVSVSHRAGIIACQQPAEWSRQLSPCASCVPHPIFSLRAELQTNITLSHPSPGPESSSATVPRVPAKYNALEIINIWAQCKKPCCGPLGWAGLLAEWKEGREEREREREGRIGNFWVLPALLCRLPVWLSSSGSTKRSKKWKVHNRQSITPFPCQANIPGCFKAILDKNLNIPSCASYIEFKNPGLHNQLSYLIKQTQTGSHGDGETNNIQNIWTSESFYNYPQSWNRRIHFVCSRN